MNNQYKIIKQIINQSAILFLLVGIVNPLFAKVQNKDSLYIMSRQDYYTEEQQGHILVLSPRHMRNKQLSFDLIYDGNYLTKEHNNPYQERILAPFPLKKLPQGKSEITCLINIDGEKRDTAVIKIIKRPPKDNAVKIDRASGGLIVDGLPWFPFGFYAYSPVQPHLFEEEVVKGFNLASPYQLIEAKTTDERRAYMDRAAELGMKVNYNLLRVASEGGIQKFSSADNKEERLAMLREEVKAFRDHPALLSWYISDEPVGREVPVEQLAETYNIIKKLDPYHPVTVVFMTPNRAHEYAKAMDIVMADPYPIPNRSVTEVSDITKSLYNEFRYKKPVWIVPQAFGGNEWWPREPTAAELRVMTYLALVNNATGIQYFIRHGLNRFPKSTNTWSEAGAISKEVAELTPALLSGEFQPEISTNSEQIKANAWQNDGQVTIAAVNTSSSIREMEISLVHSDYSDTVNVPFENRTLLMDSGSIRESIEGLDTRVYQFRTESKEKAERKIDPGNLTINPSFENNPSVGIVSGMYAGTSGDRGATFFADSRIAYHKKYALRLNTPARDQGVPLNFYPVRLKKNVVYELSIWAKAKKRPGYFLKDRRNFLEKLFGIGKKPYEQPAFRMGFGNIKSREFTLTEEWKKYTLELELVAIEEESIRTGISLELLSKGTAWFDMMQVVPLSEN